jgi:cation diffusion facilitator CzcD-associated flavoprotein CzcO
VETDETFEDDADVLIAARGALNDIAWPQIPGLRSFEGEVMHSAAWNEK